MAEFDGKIKLSDDYWMGSDGTLNFTLFEKREKREGKGKHAPLSGEFGLYPIGYYGNLENLVKGLIRHKTLSHVGEEFSEYVDIVKDVERQIIDSMKEVLPSKPKEWK